MGYSLKIECEEYDYNRSPIIDPIHITKTTDPLWEAIIIVKWRWHTTDEDMIVGDQLCIDVMDSLGVTDYSFSRRMVHSYYNMYSEITCFMFESKADAVIVYFNMSSTPP